MSEDQPITIERQSPEEAFGLLANDLRVKILQTLGQHTQPLSFSALREQVRERDSGKFNYHLGKLVGHFVIHDEEGYRLSLAGEAVYGAIVSGAYNSNAEITPFTFTGPCPLCGQAELIAEYVDERAFMYCEACGEWRNEFPFPPGSLEQFDRNELPYAFDRWMQATVAKVIMGFCSNCGGRVEGALLESEGDQYPMPIRAEYQCQRCGEIVQSYPALPVLFHPVAVAFFADHGVNVLGDPTWAYLNVADDFSIDVDSTNPLTASVEFGVVGETLRAVVNSVVAIESIRVERAT